LAPVSSHAQALPGLMIYRFHHGMYYANDESFSQEVHNLVDSAQPPLAWFCLDAVAIDDIDFSAAATLHEICNELKAKGVRLVLAEVAPDVRKQLDRSELTGVIGKDAFFETVVDVEAAYKSTVSGKSS
jgi:sulfate permease, SulP family